MRCRLVRAYVAGKSRSATKFLYAVLDESAQFEIRFPLPIHGLDLFLHPLGNLAGADVCLIDAHRIVLVTKGQNALIAINRFLWKVAPINFFYLSKASGPCEFLLVRSSLQVSPHCSRWDL